MTFIFLSWLKEKDTDFERKQRFSLGFFFPFNLALDSNSYAKVSKLQWNI